MRCLLFLLALCGTILPAHPQISARLMRYADVSETQICFVYGGDIWVMPKAGGQAFQLTRSPGEESWPRFSPDGNFIAYTASYGGNEDAYIVPVGGGIPTRLTFASFPDRVVDWHPDGDRVLIASRREMGQRGPREFFLVPKTGGHLEKLPVPYGELASYSPDGKQLAYITKITENYPFKRYRGGLASDILLFDLEDLTAENITRNPANDGKPAWAGDKVYFLSDQAENMRLNLWSYDPRNGQFSQLTHFDDFDISHMAAGPSDIVFEAGGTLYRMELASESYEPVEARIVSDLASEMPRTVDVSERIANATPSPDGKRVVIEARGELFNVPAEKGFSMNLTRSSGAFDRAPAWSPDGKTLAWWSDASGEYEIHLTDPSGMEEPRTLTHRGKGFGYALFWSPDSKSIAFIDETNTLYLVEVDNGEITRVAKQLWNLGHGSRFGFHMDWSSDSRWLTFHMGMENAYNAIFVYDTQTANLKQVTSGYYDSYAPVFSHDGKYIFFLTDRNFSALYSDLDATWIYPNATQIAAMALTGDAPYLLQPENDEVSPNQDKTEKDSTDQGVSIDFEDMESRLVILPPEAGNISTLIPMEGKLLYRRHPNTGSGERSSTLMMYDLEEREEKTVLANLNDVVATADGKSLLVASQGKWGVIQPAPDQKIEKPVPTDGLSMDLVPRQEWRQIFQDTWRRYRDFFYDPDMHQVDWASMREQYGALIEDARTRWDVTFIQSNMQAELSAGHTYTGGGDTEEVPSRNTGYLGINWDLGGGAYRIGEIIRPAAWDTETRSPLDRPGMDIEAGDYILSVNGSPILPAREPYAAFEGLAGKTVVLEIAQKEDRDSTREIIVTLLRESEEYNLRYLAWLEANRKRVDELSDGQIGYVYMSNTSSRGQLELVRMYYGQLEKKGFIIDERFNGGGRLADRFLELLQRPVVYNLHWRHGKDHTQPIKVNTGPKAMLINGWAGSGGDGLPWAFQELEAGPIIGERTLGILVGPATGHEMIDGGRITVPGARLYDNDGHWFWEGEGVSPDIEVWDDPNMLVKGRDPQIERAVQEVQKLIQASDKPAMTPAPSPDDRTAKGLSGKE